jgi:hypothetical protein
MTDRTTNPIIEAYTADALKLAEFFGVPMTYDRAKEIAMGRYLKEHPTDATTDNSDGDSQPATQEGR